MTAEEVLARAAGARVLVVGDICLDRWCRYDPALAEPSRETGIPRCAVVAAARTPGAGGTVASNLAALGAGRVAVLGVIGADGSGHELRRALGAAGIEGDLLIESDAVQTFTYTKLINAATGVEDLPRVDFVNTAPLPAASEAALIDRFERYVGEFDAVIVSDQAETAAGGTVTPAVRDAICAASRLRPGKFFLADSRERVEHFRHVIVTPNETEAADASQCEFGRVDFGRLQRLIGGPALVVTAGEQGAWLVDGDGQRLLAAANEAEVVDVCGAGDSLAAGMALGLAAGAPTEDSLRFGIIVAGVTVGKSGTGRATP